MRVAAPRPLRLAIFLLLPVLAAPAGAARLLAAQAAPVEHFERTVPLPAGGIFSLSNVNGSVQIEGWDREEAQIAALKSSAAGAEELSQVEIAVVQSPGGVSVETRYPQGGSADVSVEFRVRVPARVRLALVSTINGSVTVRSVTGSGNLVAINGSVAVSRGAGLFAARATNGNISLELLSLESGLSASDTVRPAAARAAISAQTVNGSVVVALPADADADLDARTQNGDFSSDVPLLTHSSAAGRVIRGRIGSGGPALFLRTVNGSIRLRIARPLV
jgi:hypothetical protein